MKIFFQHIIMIVAGILFTVGAEAQTEVAQMQYLNFIDSLSAADSVMVCRRTEVVFDGPRITREVFIQDMMYNKDTVYLFTDSTVIRGLTEHFRELPLITMRDYDSNYFMKSISLYLFKPNRPVMIDIKDVDDEEMDALLLFFNKQDKTFVWISRRHVYLGKFKCGVMPSLTNEIKNSITRIRKEVGL